MKKIIYSLVATLMMACAVECTAQTVSGKKGGHDYVDLGLPSGRLWATCNVGASKPTEYGDHFAWGETIHKKSYDRSNYKLSKDSCITFTKYVRSSFYGTVDNLTTLLSKDDAATVNWGSCWRMPTQTEQQELKNGCDWKWTDNFNGSGVAGRIGTSKANGNTIFLPASGHRNGMNLFVAGDCGFYWSSSFYLNFSICACSLVFDSNGIDWDCYGRYYGHSVRAVVK